MRALLRAQARKTQARGFLLIEIALAIVVLGIIAAAVYPLLNLAASKESSAADSAALAQARDGLVAYAVLNGGFPGPLALQMVGGTGGALSRTALANSDAGSLTVVNPSENPYGAVPAHLIGTPRTSSKGTLFNYDVHPALRADHPFDLSGLTDLSAQGLSSLHAMDRNNQGTGGSVSQLCRNLNTLIDMERRLQASPTQGGDGANYRVNLPRTWQTGVAAFFNWSVDYNLFIPTNDMNASITTDWLLQRSSPAAFVVTRPNALALTRFDRANAVFSQDIPTDDQKQYPVKGYRMYEDPASGATDSASNDLRDYGGATAAVSLVQFRSALQSAGQCMRGADTCLNTEIQLTIDNALAGQYYTDSAGTRTAVGAPLGLPVYWSVNQAASALVGGSSSAPPTDSPNKFGTVASGINRAACVPVLDASASFTALPARTLNVFTILPDGRYWFLKSLPLRGNVSPVLPADDVLDSGKSHAATVKCYANAPLPFESDTAPGSYKVSAGGADSVSCIVNSD